MINARKTAALSLLVIITLFPKCGQDRGNTPAVPDNAGNNRIGIIITANTALRIDPLTFTSRIDQLKKGEVIEILDRSPNEQTIGGQKSYWYRVKLPSGITGWVFGANINIMQDSSSENVESYLSQFWEKETDELSEALHGKWWSINRFGDYTNHCLEIYKDGKYKSYIKGSTKKIEGNYNFDFNKSMVIFLAGTSFEGDLNFVRRGDIFTLYRETSNDEIRFKKINMNPESETEEQATQKPEENADNIKKEDEN